MLSEQGITRIPACRLGVIKSDIGPTGQFTRIARAGCRGYADACSDNDMRRLVLKGRLGVGPSRLNLIRNLSWPRLP